jgi:ubiquinone/menaquinone biosynthesis C-methylase UbiE
MFCAPIFSARDEACLPDEKASAYEGAPLPIPDYLEKYYWWAYVRPWGVWVFEREWLVNLILWGWYKPLRDVALKALGDKLSGRTLQISCCYGTFTPKLTERVIAGGGTLDVLDVSPAQLDNLRRKIASDAPVRILMRNSTNLEGLATASYDRVILFFLPHEQPRDVRSKTIAEAFRVVKPTGEILVIEFGKAKIWHPLKWLWLPFLKYLEPFAPDIWDHAPESWLAYDAKRWVMEKTPLFGGFYQKIVMKSRGE